MKTITLRGVDDELSSALKQAARQAGTSINQFVLDRLRLDVGLKKKRRFTATYHDLDKLFGSWSENEYNAISERLQKQRTIDEELWR
jgi:uncharacterized protein (DUF1778 family)